MEKVTAITLTNLENAIKNDILYYNDKSTDYVFKYEIKENFIIALGYSKVNMKFYDAAIYRMHVLTIYGESLYKNGNVVDYKSMYTLNDVLNHAKGYFNGYAKELNNINL